MIYFLCGGKVFRVHSEPRHALFEVVDYLLTCLYFRLVCGLRLVSSLPLHMIARVLILSPGASGRTRPSSLYSPPSVRLSNPIVLFDKKTKRKYCQSVRDSHCPA